METGGLSDNYMGSLGILCNLAFSNSWYQSQIVDGCGSFNIFSSGRKK